MADQQRGQHEAAAHHRLELGGGPPHHAPVGRRDGRTPCRSHPISKPYALVVPVPPQAARTPPASCISASDFFAPGQQAQGSLRGRHIEVDDAHGAACRSAETRFGGISHVRPALVGCDPFKTHPRPIPNRPVPRIASPRREAESRGSGGLQGVGDPTRPLRVRVAAGVLRARRTMVHRGSPNCMNAAVAAEISGRACGVSVSDRACVTSSRMSSSSRSRPSSRGPGIAARPTCSTSADSALADRDRCARVAPPGSGRLSRPTAL